MTDAPIRVAAGAATHPGRRRPVNEDAHLATAPLFLVADGMGRHDAGDLANQIVVASSPRSPGSRRSASTTCARRSRARASVEGSTAATAPCGTTLSGVVVTESKRRRIQLTVNVGDSRTYRFAGGVLEQISVDHSVVQELIDAGALDADEAATDQRRHEITRAIGAGSDARPGDRIWCAPTACRAR